jgi:hypothetical protein
MTRRAAPVADALSRNYAQLKGPERFALMLEAMARGDEAEADRLEETCPRHGYTIDDPEFRDRMKRAYAITTLVTINLKWRIEQIRSKKLFCDLHEDFAWGPQLVATTAFLYGREYGRWECRAIEQIPLIDAGETAALMKGRPDLREQLRELRAIATESVLRVAETLKYAIGEVHAVEVLSQWEGYGRFCRRHLGVEALRVISAFRLGNEDPAAEVLAAYPDAAIDEATAAQWEANWAREWERRFERDNLAAGTMVPASACAKGGAQR